MNDKEKDHEVDCQRFDLRDHILDNNLLAANNLQPNTSGDDNMDEDAITKIAQKYVVEEDVDLEYQMSRNSFLMRTKILLIGIDVFAEKSTRGYRPDVDFKEIKRDIVAKVSDAIYYFENGNYDDSERLVNAADKVYSEMAITLPKDSIGKSNNKRIENQNHTSIKATAINEKQIRGAYSTSVVRSGDLHDVDKCIKVAEKALADKNFDKAERFLLKAQKILPTKNAGQLLDIVQAKIEQARLEGVKRKSALEEEERRVKAKLVEDQNTKVEEARDRTTVSEGRVQGTYSYPVTQSGDILDVDKCITVAGEALAENDLNKAERLLLKAQKILSTKKTGLLDGVAETTLEDVKLKLAQLEEKRREEAKEKLEEARLAQLEEERKVNAEEERVKAEERREKDRLARLDEERRINAEKRRNEAKERAENARLSRLDEERRVMAEEKRKKAGLEDKSLARFTAKAPTIVDQPRAVSASAERMSLKRPSRDRTEDSELKLRRTSARERRQEDVTICCVIL